MSNLEWCNNKNYSETYNNLVSQDYKFLWEQVKDYNKIFVVLFDTDNKNLSFLEVAQIRLNSNRVIISTRGIGHFEEGFTTERENYKDFLYWCKKVNLYYFK